MPTGINGVHAVIDRAIELAFGQLRLGKDGSPNAIEQIVDLVGAGRVDAAIEASAPPVEAQRVNRRFEDQQEFSQAA